LGVLIDADLSAAEHVRLVVSGVMQYATSRQLRQFVSDDCFRLLMLALVHTQLDYDNFVVVGLLAYRQRHLQRVFNLPGGGARLIDIIFGVTIVPRTSC
jgi:hypothetical protein